MGAFQDSIAALSTPVGEAGIGVVRVTGDAALDVIADVFRDGSGRVVEEFGHRRLYHGRVVSGKGDTIDEVVVGVFRGPESYTGEDVAEVSCHGGTVTVSRLLDRLYEAGARPAQPGEFTKRAFLNGKMDLIQAEAVADIIHARSELQQRVAQKQLEGGLSAKIDAMADDMVTLRADIEANIDFIEEGIDSINIEGAVSLVDAQMAALDELLESAPLTRPFREGFSVVIAGPVNAGKSSLFNRLAGQDRAIVTDIPGTTRDVLREPVLLDGLLFVFQDTAGMREGTGDRVEEIGMDLAAAAVRSADAVLFVVDGSVEMGSEVVDAIAGVELERGVLVVNKADIGRSDGMDEALGALHDRRVVNVSALSGDGLEELRSVLIDVAGGEALSRMARERFVLNERLVTLLGEARERCVELRAGLCDPQPLEILADEVREVLVRYEEATGRRYQDNLLDAIFSRFCLGK